MQTIEGVLFEPVGSLADFPAEPFLEIAARLSRRKRKTSKSGSRAYWHTLNLMETLDQALDQDQRKIVEGLELQAVAEASLYEDVLPALAELKAMGISLIITSSLSNAAVKCFLEKCPADIFSGVWSRESAEGIKSAPLLRALSGASLLPEHAVFLTDTFEGMNVAKSVGVQAVLMMNDPDEARRLTMHKPAGGIVSLHELPDFIHFVAADNAEQQ